MFPFVQIIEDDNILADIFKFKQFLLKFEIKVKKRVILFAIFGSSCILS